jgi:AcrR family transcriptional regulator
VLYICQAMFDSGSSAAVAAHKKGRVPRALREQQLLDIAEELFLTKGYDATSIEDVCRLAGVSRPTIYHLFENKAALYLACVRRSRSSFDHELATAALGATDPFEQLRRASDTYFRMLESDPRRWQLMFGKHGVVGELAEELAVLRTGTVEVIAALLRSYAPAADPDRIRAYANLISGAAEQLGRTWIDDPGSLGDAVAREQADFLWSGARELRDAAPAESLAS